jgi:hypothetical protein
MQSGTTDGSNNKISERSRLAVLNSHFEPAPISLPPSMATSSDEKAAALTATPSDSPTMSVSLSLSLSHPSLPCPGLSGKTLTCCTVMS